MKICVYVSESHAKQNYKRESYNVRKRRFARLKIYWSAMDMRWICGQPQCTITTLFLSALLDCDWWPFIAERIRWRKGNYKVIVGGAGALNVRPFLEHADYFVLGR